MSGIAGSEVFLLIIIGLIVLGPKRLPQVANQIGTWLGQARRMTRMMKRQLEDEVNLDLNKFNIQQQLGLEPETSTEDAPADNASADNASADKGATDKAADVSTPTYVHEKKRDAPTDSEAGAAPEAAAAAEGANPEPEPELPDDYSPAHPPDSVGTGVEDGDDYIDDDELEPVLKVDAGDDLVPPEPPPHETKETA